VRQQIDKLLSINGDRTVDSFHKELGSILWDNSGMARTKEGLTKALQMVRELKAEFWRNVKVTGENEDLNQTLERAGRVADFFELGELIVIDALHREESCGCHFRVESQTEDGEALRDDSRFAYVAAWEYAGGDGKPVLHKEELEYHNIEMKQRSYK
ncbi:MAG: fumarate reductase/succinate dehydrogenase flavoprotein subunit, partial [Dermatophilaceae bacterium]